MGGAMHFRWCYRAGRKLYLRCRVATIGLGLLSKASWVARRCQNEKRDTVIVPDFGPKILRQLLLTDELSQVFRTDDHQARNDRNGNQ